MRTFVLVALLALASCGTEPPAPPPARDDWFNMYDLDGDGVRDLVTSKFSGGAHCCYRFGAELSSRGGELVMLPFWFDGGYCCGMELIDIPERFAIRSDASGTPEIYVEIATYNGQPAPLEPEWLTRYGVRSHCIAVSFAGGDVRVRSRSESLKEPELITCPAIGEGETP